MLDIRDLSVAYDENPTVSNVSFSVADGEIFCIIGKSGSGKSSILNAITGMLGRNGSVTSGCIKLNNKVIFENGKYTAGLREVRGKELAVITQQPDKSLDPVFTIGNQMIEIMRVAGKISKEGAWEKGRKLFEQLMFNDPERIWRSYPHELSGGMCQRVAVAMALANKASLLLADEPTSALDVTVQAELVKLLYKVSRENDLSILLVTHNMDVARVLSNRIGLLEDGALNIAEGKNDIFADSR